MDELKCIFGSRVLRRGYTIQENIVRDAYMSTWRSTYYHVSFDFMESESPFVIYKGYSICSICFEYVPKDFSFSEEAMQDIVSKLQKRDVEIERDNTESKAKVENEVAELISKERDRVEALKVEHASVDKTPINITKIPRSRGNDIQHFLNRIVGGK